MKWVVLGQRVAGVVATLFFTTLWPYFPAEQAYANPTVNITLFVTPGIPTLQPPTNLTVTPVGTDMFQVTWTPDPLATLTVLRLARENYPTTNTSYQLIYAGSDNSVLVTGQELESYGGFISAWSENATASSLTYAKAVIGGGSMVFLAFLAMAGILSFFGLRSYFWYFKALAGLSWVAVAFYVIASPPSGVVKGDTTHNLLIALLFAVSIGCFIYAFGNERERTEVDKDGRGSQLMRAFKAPNPGGESAPRGESIEAYRERIRGAYGRGRGTVRRRRE